MSKCGILRGCLNRAQALGRGDIVKYVYKTVANGIAGEFTSETFEHLLEHEHVESLEADCAIGIPDDKKVATEDIPESIKRAAATAKTKGVSSMQQMGAVWGSTSAEARTLLFPVRL